MFLRRLLLHLINFGIAYITLGKGVDNCHNERLLKTKRLISLKEAFEFDN